MCDTRTDETRLAERARTALADATVATLYGGGCRVGRVTDIVDIEDRAEGPVITVSAASPAVQAMVPCPIITLVLPGPGSFRTLRLVGTTSPLPAESDGAHRSYQLGLLSVRLVGTTCTSVPVAAFLTAAPDPLRQWATSAVRHLETAHSAELLACVRAHGHAADAVLPRSIDRYGLELAVLSADAVCSVRLEFPGGPVSGIDEVDAGLRMPLTCRCSAGDHCQP
ncbi:hypothetical protein CLV56_3278 [Mumia flava]|uniref:DUF2470 domain-containing protein n=1 Tax=Mumia flava TaxID=1348852 RepID=A0A0B2BN11_9ACTN|nr:DUF2470 domain-containing protein [Mumia flava]PJJ53782.1 hypothetical protein CLV56_3278 [Mumia flava]